MTIKSLEQLNLDRKRVLVRVDYNVPMKGTQISDDSRITASLETLRYLLDRGCRLTLMSHLGRPKGGFDEEFSMAPVAHHLAGILGREVSLVRDFEDGGEHGAVQILENLRFAPGETKDDAAFAQTLARYAEVYINDAFGAAHRAHASTHAVCKFFPQRGAGFLMMKELRYLRDALADPERPFLAILGGSKISDKLAVVKQLLKKVDSLIIGGAMSFTFLKARGIEVGTSLVEDGFIEQAREIDAYCRQKGIGLLLPLDHVAAQSFSEDADPIITLDENIPSGLMGLDIGPETINLFTSVISQSKTIVWNGPMGVFEWPPFSTGTVSVAEAMAAASGLTVVGGGDSVAAVHEAGVTESITHISTGGGASLDLLAGKELPGIAALEL